MRAYKEVKGESKKNGKGVKNLLKARAEREREFCGKYFRNLPDLNSLIELLAEVFEDNN